MTKTTSYYKKVGQIKNLTTWPLRLPIGSSLEAISKQMKVPQSIVQSIVCKYTNLGTKQTGKRYKLSEEKIVMSTQLGNYHFIKNFTAGIIHCIIPIQI